MNLRPPGYEPGELPDCSTPRRIQDVSAGGIEGRYRPSVLADALAVGDRACRSLKSRNHVRRVSGGSAWDAVLGPVLRPSDPLAHAGGLDGDPLQAPPLPFVAVLVAIRHRPGAGLLLHRRGGSPRGDQVAQPRLDLVRPHAALAAALFSITSYFALRTPDDGGGEGGEPGEDVPEPPWWPDFERDFRDYTRLGPGWPARIERPRLRIAEIAQSCESCLWWLSLGRRSRSRTSSI